MTTTQADTVVNLLGVIVAVTNQIPRILVADGGHDRALPSGPFDPKANASLEEGFRRMIEAQAGLDLNYVEQLYTFGNRYRTEDEMRGGPRTLSVAYVALAHEEELLTGGTRWVDLYEHLPWEDWRDGRPAMLDTIVEPRLKKWCSRSSKREIKHKRTERVNVSFGYPGAAELDAVLTLERLELLYDSGILAESDRDTRILANEPLAPLPTDIGVPMSCDHRRVLATALGRIRGKLAYRPVVFELLPGEFTLFQLQQVAEALSGAHLHKQNFRRLVMNADLVEAIGRTVAVGRGRPAELFRFRREVLGEKLTVGLSRPTLREE